MIHPRTPRRLAALTLTLALGAGLVSCSADPVAAPEDSPVLRVLVRDAVLRPLDVPCAGSRPYLDLHEGTTVTVVDDADATLLAAELPEGRSIAADDRDYGTAAKQPSMCEFTVPAPGLDAGEYRVRVGERTFDAVVVDAEGAFIAIPPLGIVPDLPGAP